MAVTLIDGGDIDPPVAAPPSTGSTRRTIDTGPVWKAVPWRSFHAGQVFDRR
jgi:hypothetical protein